MQQMDEFPQKNPNKINTKVMTDISSQFCVFLKQVDFQ